MHQPPSRRPRILRVMFWLAAALAAAALLTVLMGNPFAGRQQKAQPPASPTASVASSTPSTDTTCRDRPDTAPGAVTRYVTRFNKQPAPSPGPLEPPPYTYESNVLRGSKDPTAIQIRDVHSSNLEWIYAGNVRSAGAFIRIEKYPNTGIFEAINIAPSDPNLRYPVKSGFVLFAAKICGTRMVSGPTSNR